MKEEENEQENEEGNEQIPNDGRVGQLNWNRPQVSSVEEITGQNLNFHNMNQVMGMQNNLNINANINNIQNTGNQIETPGGMVTQTKIVKTQITKDSNNNIVDYQRQQKIIRETPHQAPMQQNVNYGAAALNQYSQQYMNHQVDNFINNQMNNMSNAINQNQNPFLGMPQISSTGQHNQNDLRTNIGNRHIQSYAIRYEQNVDPMMYSFGGKSASNETQKPAAPVGIEHADNVVSNSDFIISSMNNNDNINMGALQQSGYTLFQNNNLGINNNIDNIMNQNGGFYMNNNYQMMSRTNQNINESGRFGANVQSEINKKVQYIQVTSSNQASGSIKEPLDGSSKKKKKEEEMKHAEISDFPLEPRDSRRKS